MIILCSYPLERSRAADILDVARAHEFAIARRVGTWEVLQWRPAPSTPDFYGTLTAREREVFGLAVEGRSNPEIGGHLSISVRTARVTGRASCASSVSATRSTWSSTLTGVPLGIRAQTVR
jgi:FixJ family two-component response regulator